MQDTVSTAFRHLYEPEEAHITGVHLTVVTAACASAAFWCVFEPWGPLQACRRDVDIIETLHRRQNYSLCGCGHPSDIASPEAVGLR